MKPHILVVEDSELVTDALRALLEASGYRVSDAATAEDAIALASIDAVDVMLLDLTLPDGDGLEVLGALGGEGMLPRATIVMTGDAEPETRRRCLDAGAAEVLLKPVSIAELRRAITSQLG